ncbi:MAG: glycosyltransferase 87 family protein [Candidatus Parvarchaeota archaeon]
MKAKKERSQLQKLISRLTSERFVLLVSFLVLFVFSSLVFYLLKNWDMVVRILNARHMFEGGYYYEPMRAVFESFVIGLFSFISSSYAVYIFILFTSIVFLISVFYLAKIMKLNFPFLFMFLLSPFILFYGIKNGSDLLVIAFLILYVSAIMKEKPVFAGVFLALAFLSKSYALIFSPLLLFLLWGKDMKGVFKFFVAALVAIAALIPYFIYNFLEYGNFIYSIGMSYLYFHIFSSYVSLSISLAHFESIPLIGFLEVIFPLALLAYFYLRDRSSFYAKLVKNKKEYSIIVAACVLSFVVYFSVSNILQATGLSIFRFMLPLSVFLYILAFSFFRRKEMKFVYIIFIISVAIAVVFLISNLTSAFHISYAEQAVSLFNSVYSGRCTVASNEWVYLDYLGLYAVPYQPYQNYSGAILNFGSFNTSLPLIKKQGNLYLYGLKNCSYYPSIFMSRTYYVMQQENIMNNACYWIFGINPRIEPLYSLCNSTNSFLRGVFK